MSVGRGEGMSLCVKFQTSRILPSGIFWWGYSCYSCYYSGKTKSTPSPKAEAWTLAIANIIIIFFLVN